ncbi:MAG: HlyD family secretion protein [Granulosicoccus sp.]
MLFRKEVLEQRSSRLYGSVFIAVPMRFSIITGFLFGIIAIAVVFLSIASFSRIEAVVGAIVPSKGIVHVLAPASGVLTDLELLEGQSVYKGQVIGVITSATAVAGQGTRTEAELNSIQEQLRRLEDQTTVSASISELEIAALERRHQELTTRHIQATNMLNLEQNKFSEAKSAFARFNKMYKNGLLDAESLSQKNISRITARQDVERLKSQITAIELESNNIEFEKEEINARTKLEQLRLEAEQLSLQGQLDILVGKQIFEVVAPASGKVAVILVSSGYNVSHGRKLLSILPEESELQAELYVPSRAIGFVEPGQDVRLLLDAFPYQRFGAQLGSISQVSSSVILPGGPDLLVDVQEPFYRVIVKLDRGSISAFDKEIPIQVGMRLSANIVLEERSIFTWLLEPLLSVTRRT